MACWCGVGCVSPCMWRRCSKRCCGMLDLALARNDVVDRCLAVVDQISMCMTSCISDFANIMGGVC